MKSFLTSIILSFWIFMPEKMQGQEIIPVYSDYLTDNLYLLHPSMAGASNKNKIRLTARDQWFGIRNAPTLQTINAHAKIGEKIGLGGIVFNDKNGNYSKRGAYFTFAYHLVFSRTELELNQLSFGISPGIIQHSLDQSKFTEFDPLLEGNNYSDLYGNVDAGISYYYNDLFFHATAKNILPINRELFYSGSVPDNQRMYLLSSGYVFDSSYNSWSFEPSLLLIWKEQTSEKFIDANFKSYYHLFEGNLFGGLSYRIGADDADPTANDQEEKKVHPQYLTPFIGFNYKKFLFAYTFSSQINTQVLSNTGFHQITLGYDFGTNRVRYDCACPAINQSSYSSLTK